VPDAVFADPVLAAVYDAFDGDRGDLTAYLEIADELAADRVLDIGCGTGSLAVLLAAKGRDVVGVDPAEASLAIAKSKDPAAGITWICGDAAAATGLRADLVVMTGNVAQVFLTDDEWTQCLRDIHAALQPSGYLVFETRRTERRVWEEWATNTDPVIVDVPGTGTVQQRREVTEVRLPFVSFRDAYTFLSNGSVVTSDSTLRFRGREELETTLAGNGFRVLDVREAPDRPGREWVFVCERTT
jgi:SAM-dependent methyltransferase